VFLDTGITIDGVDVTPYIAHQGVKWTRSDVDGPNAGRTITGLMIRDRVATKIRLDITCRPLTGDELHTLLNVILPVFVQVTYEDPMLGLVTKTMYANNNSVTYFKKKTEDGNIEYWIEGSFPLVER